MKNINKQNKQAILPKIARSLGQHSVDSACIWWYHQPKVPASMKKEEKNN